MSTVEENMRLMQTLDDAWNTQDWAMFEKRHAAHVDVFWPGQADRPTAARPTRKRRSHFSRSSRTTRSGTGRTRYSSGRGLHVLCRGVHRYVQGPDDHARRKSHPANGKKFRVEFCTVAHWKNGEIVEERLFYDKMSLMQQIGLM